MLASEQGTTRLNSMLVYFFWWWNSKLAVQNPNIKDFVK